MAFDLTWPVYFATRDLVGKRLTIKAGEPFPIQDKGFIRGLAQSYGVADAQTCAFTVLPYVRVLNVHSTEMARQIREQGLSLTEAEARVTTEPRAKRRATA